MNDQPTIAINFIEVCLREYLDSHEVSRPASNAALAAFLQQHINTIKTELQRIPSLENQIRDLQKQADSPTDQACPFPGSASDEQNVN